MHYMLAVFVFFSFAVFTEEEKPIVLSATAIGSMKIEVGMPISLFQVSKGFPFYRVSQEIGQGDSPDFHLFKVSSHDNEDLIYFISYIKAQADYEKAVVKLDEIMTCSDKVMDEFGISPKMTIKQALQKRKGLQFGAGHMDNYLGLDNIWYLFSVNGLHGTGVSKEVALKADPQIDCISWPYARWR